MRCKHPLRWGMRLKETVDGLTWVKCPDDEATHLECCDCHEHLPWGHSDEGPVRVEVRAAELVADGYKRGTMVYVDESHCNHWYDDDGPCCKCGFDGDVETVCQAGYLARCIVDHNGGEE